MRSVKVFLLTILVSLSNAVSAQLDGNTTPTYPELIKIYEQLANEHEELQLYNMGASDYGLPIYLFVINAESDSLATMKKAQNETTVLINNGIHPGEPDGINACLIWVNDWIKKGKKTKNLPVIGIIPAYNVGGMMNRSGTSRANQEGPEEYGFRGNAQNLDLNRDFIKMDSKNAFTFVKIFHALNPDVFIDTHVSNGADYQYTLTYIASIKDRLAPSMRKITYDNLIPYLHGELNKDKEPMISYVNLLDDVPEKGMSAFNDLPRYSMGYTALFNTISFTVETHMLKPFPKRTQATLKFLDHTIQWTADHSSEIEKARSEAFNYDQSTKKFPYNYELSKKHKDSILFKGFEHSRPKSEITGLERLKYHRDQPFAKYIPFYEKYIPKDEVEVPEYYVLGGECAKVIERLKANGITMKRLNGQEVFDLDQMRVDKVKSPNRAYEGHFLHSQMQISKETKRYQPKPGDYLIPMGQQKRRFILSVLEPGMPDSYFAWNFFDSYLQQKEYFSPYVFEDKALEILENNPELKEAFEAKKRDDEKFRESSWAQLYFIYQHTDYYEPTHNVLPIRSSAFK